MELRTCLNLSKYLITADGSVIQGDEILPFPKKKGLALQTDEVMPLPLTKKKVKLIRRFSRDEIVKLFQSKHSVIFDADAPVTKPKIKRISKAKAKP